MPSVTLFFTYQNLVCLPLGKACVLALLFRQKLLSVKWARCLRFCWKVCPRVVCELISPALTCRDFLVFIAQGKHRNIDRFLPVWTLNLFYWHILWTNLSIFFIQYVKLKVHLGLHCHIKMIHYWKYYENRVIACSTVVESQICCVPRFWGFSFHPTAPT